MNVKTKLCLGILRISNDNRKARKIAKKNGKDESGERYPEQWRNSFVLKRVKRMSKRLNIELEVEGFDKLPKGAFILTPNHSSAFDPALVVMALEQVDPAIEREDIVGNFLAKEDLKENKKLKGWAGMLDTFYLSRTNSREALKTLDEWVGFCKENKRAGVIFPEGTRSKTGEIQEFKAGAFRSAKKAYLPIVPCTINNALSISDFSRTGKLKVQVIFHDPIKPSTFMSGDYKSIALKVEKAVKSRWVKSEGKRSGTETKLG